MKKYLFIIQGEGRGHLTQAIALAEMLERAGHTVVASLVGVSEKGEVPHFFQERITSPIISFNSPSLIYHPVSKNLSINRTVLNAIRFLPRYIKSISKIQEAVRHYQPDLIINFYDVLGGIHQLLSKSPWFESKPLVCVAHQYLLLHDDFVYPDKYQAIDRFLVNFNTRITSLFASKKLALSFREMPDCPQKKISVVPPLLRSEVWDLHTKTTDKCFILAYMTQPYMEKELTQWHTKNPNVEIHCFSSRLQMPNVLKHSKNLYFHKIDGKKFLSMMAECRAVVTTAGFESVCEAMALSKPVMMIPLRKHFEQTCNAFDAQISGAGITAASFNLSPLMLHISEKREFNDEIQQWFQQSDEKILSEVCDNQYFIANKIYERYEFDERTLQPI